MRFRYMIRKVDGDLVYAEGEDADSAIASIGLTPADVRRHMPIRWLDRPSNAMPEDVKAKLKQVNEERRAIRKVRRSK